VIRGAHDDFAALCTVNQVFDIKSAETSNTLLLASPRDACSTDKENGCISLKVNTCRHVAIVMLVVQGQFDSTFQIRINTERTEIKTYSSIVRRESLSRTFR
jgi:hypothetical protein